MLGEIKTVKERVKALLTEKPELRDSDRKLMAFIWSKESGADDNSNLTAREFLSQLWNEKLTKSEAIRRSRQILQAEEPSLRGNNYQGRKDEEEVVRSGINEV
jgi:hypothetical protein